MVGLSYRSRVLLAARKSNLYTRLYSGHQILKYKINTYMSGREIYSDCDERMCRVSRHAIDHGSCDDCDMSHSIIWEAADVAHISLLLPAPSPELSHSGSARVEFQVEGTPDQLPIGSLEEVPSSASESLSKLIGSKYGCRYRKV